MSVGDPPLLGAAELARETRAGTVRYVLIGTPKCMREGGIASCPPVLRWARAHGTDVSLAAGLPHRGVLYRLAPRHARGHAADVLSSTVPAELTNASAAPPGRSRSRRAP